MSLLAHLTLLTLAATAVHCQRGGGTLVFHGEDNRPTPAPRPTRVEIDANGEIVCPLEAGVYEDPEFCDKYWKCDVHGRPTEKDCGDGLVFDFKKSGSADPCDTPHVVHCGDRQALQPASLFSQYCPRLYGSFEHPDPTVCNVYYQCIDGKHTEVACATGLYFNSSQGSCNWPAIAQREGCVDEPLVSQDGAFSCPPGPFVREDGQAQPHPSFPNDIDCAKFYVCLNGITPQEASCDKGLVFDSKSQLCALPDTVPECAGWYANDPAFAHYYEDVPTSGRKDPGNVDVVG